MTNTQMAIWYGFILLAFVLGFYIGKYDDEK
jgi:hypothetical protein